MIVENGITLDWDAAASLLQHHVKHSLGCDLAGQAAVVVEQAHAPRDERSQWAEWLLESAAAGSLFVSRSGVLGLYAHGRTSGLAVDVGWSGTSITPVADGYPYMMGVQHVPGGARVVDSILATHLQAAGVVWDAASAAWTRSSTTAAPASTPAPLLPAATRGDVQHLTALSDLRHRIAVVSAAPLSAGQGVLPPQTPPGQEPMGHKAATEAAALPVASDQLPQSHGTLTLPDGTPVQVGPCYTAAEALFHPASLIDIEGGTDLTQALTDCGMSVDPAIRELLFENTVLFGGGSALPGLRSRLLLEAAEVASIMGRPMSAISSYAPVHACAPWTGGSILGCLPSFGDMAVTKAEWQEHGANILLRKFP